MVRILRRGGGDVAGFGDEGDDDDVADEEDEGRARNDAGEEADVLDGDSEGEGETSEGPGEKDGGDAELGEAEEPGDGSEAVVPPHGAGFLRFDVVEIARLHGSERFEQWIRPYRAVRGSLWGSEL